MGNILLLHNSPFNDDYLHSFIGEHPEVALALTTLAMGQIEPPKPWFCSAYHWNPDTEYEFLNAPTRDHCEICNRPKPSR